MDKTGFVIGATVRVSICPDAGVNDREGLKLKARSADIERGFSSNVFFGDCHRERAFTLTTHSLCVFTGDGLPCSRNEVAGNSNIDAAYAGWRRFQEKGAVGGAISGQAKRQEAGSG